MRRIQRVLIAGGGIAGMSLAIALQRVGISATIVEIDRDWRVYGAGITITG
jgi:2-polyprenyl-6-methoxyphenol hydroxylase-like FAD-dependent oxidoreductase